MPNQQPPGCEMVPLPHKRSFGARGLRATSSSP